MEIIEVEQKKMDALRALADINMRISSTRAELATLDLNKEEYFSKREKEIVDRIAKLVQESREALKEAGVNFDELHAFAKQIFAFSDQITEFHGKLLEINDLLGKKASQFEKYVANQEDKFEEVRKGLKIDLLQLKSSQEALNVREKEVHKKEIKANDMIEMLKRDISRVKEGRI